jgi:hypothetical protein
MAVLTINDLILATVRVVVKGGREIAFFENEKDAGAYVQHVYGLAPWPARQAGVDILSIVDRGPQPGDAFVTTSHRWCDRVNGEPVEARGVLCREAGVLAACFNARAFRDENGVSVSGGPIPFVEPEDLHFVGLHRQRFWRWADGFPSAHNDGEYHVTVPLWRLEK